MATNVATVRPNDGNYCPGHPRGQALEKRIAMKMCDPANQLYSATNPDDDFRLDDAYCALAHL